jgi:4-hydroxy-2-oxoheptanedioate aldolase
MVRVTTNDAPTILRFLDTGAHGVHVPWVNSAADAERAARSVKYTPRGIRGLAGSRASEWGLREPIGEYVQRANRETLVVIQIETQDAVDAIDEYLTIDDIDVLFLGPTDLSQSLGHPGDLRHPDVLAAMDRVADAVVGSGTTLGIYAGTVDMTKEWLDRGARYFTTSLEPFLRDGMRAHLRDVRG